MNKIIPLLILSFLITPSVFAQSARSEHGVGNVHSEHGVGNEHSEHGVGNGGDPRELFLFNAVQSIAESPQLNSGQPGDNLFKFSVEARTINLRITPDSGACVRINLPEQKAEITLSCFQALENNPKALLLTLTNAVAATAGIEALDSENFGPFSKALVDDGALQRYSSRVKFLSDDCLYRFDSRLKLDDEILTLAQQTLSGHNYHFSPNATLVIGVENGYLSLLGYDTANRSLTRFANTETGFNFSENVRTETRRVKEANVDSFLTELLKLPFCRTR